MAITGHESGEFKMTASLDYLTGMRFILWFRWAGANVVAGDQITVLDDNGDTIFASVASPATREEPGAAYEEQQDLRKWVLGINITRMDHGVLYVGTA